jgi:phosphatidate cytidylyltransferase
MSSVAIFVLILVIYFSTYTIFKPLFVLATLVFICSALWEFYRIATAKGFLPLTKIGIISSVLYTFATFYKTQFHGLAPWPEMVLGAALMTAFLYYFIKGSDPFVNLALTLFGLVYLTIPLNFIININFFFSDDAALDGRWWLFYLLAVTKMTDTGAYVCGKIFGHSKLAPYISPRKTWEGALGGLIAALATSVLLQVCSTLFFAQSPLGLTFLQSLWLGPLISLLGQFGDLAESLLKRDVGVKDSNQLPGLGGVLDVVDSLIFTAPFVYLVLKLTHGVSV